MAIIEISLLIGIVGSGIASNLMNDKALYLRTHKKRRVTRKGTVHDRIKTK